MINLTEQKKEPPLKNKKEPPLKKKEPTLKKEKSSSGGNIPKPQDQPTDDGIPKPASGGDIKIQLIYTKTNLPIQNQNFVSAIQKALNKGNDYSSNNIFK